MKIKICPQCKSTNVIMPRGDNTLWKCNNCGFQAAIFPEKEIEYKTKLKNKRK